MEQLKQWYEGLDNNEQRIVMLAAVFFGVLILIFGLLKPINDSLNSLQSQVNSREKSVALWKQSMPQIIANRGNTNTSSSSLSLSNLVTSSTRKYQLRVSRVQEKGPTEIQVWFDNVPFNEFIKWVAELENGHSVSIESVNIRTKDRDGLSSIDVKIQRG
ncbi:type II secretion system protein GspM [Aliikangiella sp. IMCC44359]|uniref:type II secretion system protein GspM n=1 Tax=Aliikangiella sp. IMCC44359 TaxID=3459125 RepID=UPI00403ACB2C